MLTCSTLHPVHHIVLPPFVISSWRCLVVNFCCCGPCLSHPELQTFTASRLTFVSSVRVVSIYARKCSGRSDSASQISTIDHLDRALFCFRSILGNMETFGNQRTLTNFIFLPGIYHLDLYSFHPRHHSYSSSFHGNRRPIHLARSPTSLPISPITHPLFQNPLLTHSMYSTPAPNPSNQPLIHPSPFTPSAPPLPLQQHINFSCCYACPLLIEAGKLAPDGGEGTKRGRGGESREMGRWGGRSVVVGCAGGE